MKLKKIISVLAAISMVSSLGFTAVNAANADNPIIHVDSAKFTATDTTNYKAVDGYTTYVVSYSVEGLDRDLDDTATGITVNYLVDDLSKVDAKSFIASVLDGKPSKIDLNGLLYHYAVPVFNMGSDSANSSANFSLAKPDGLWGIFDYSSSGPSTEKSKVFMQSLIYVKDGESVTFTYRTGKDGGGNDTTKIVMHDGSAYTTAINFKVNGEATNTLTLGEVAKTKYTVKFVSEGVEVQSDEVEEGAVITAPADPVKDGYTFVGWYDGETKFVESTKASKNVTYTAKFTKDPVSVTKITISGVAETMTVGDTGTATAKVEPADADKKTVTWSSSAEDVLAINATTGAYEALKAGTAVITATAADGSSVTATVNVTVNAPAPAEQKITVGPRFKGTTNKGFVWRVTVENFKNAGLSYKFTDEDTSKVRENDFNLGTLELSNFVFDVIMNTERANVKLEVK